MTSFQLKILACLFMAADHIGYIFFPAEIGWRLVGRLSFPIFAFLIAEGYEKTGNLKRYFIRLLIFGFISQPVFQLVLRTRDLNIFLTLSAGLLAILQFDKIKNKKLGFLLLALIATAAHLLEFDYGAYGIFTIFFFWFYRRNKDFPKLLLSQFLIISFYVFIERLKFINGNFSLNSFFFTQYLSAFTLFLVYLYNGERGRRLKYLFYAFYPAHLLILGMIRYIIK